MDIRSFKKDDSRRVSRLLIKTQRDTMSKHYPKKVIDMFCKYRSPSCIRDKFNSNDYFLAIDNRKLLGVVGIKNDEVDVLFVNPTHHRKGIGKYLMLHIEKIARQRKIRKLKCKSSLGADSFYKKTGFKRIRRITHEANNVKFDVILMEKQL
jgi:GNAT superfamily N-acetyltransferase